MQIQSLRIKSYRSFKVDERRYSPIAKEKYQQLQHFDKLRTAGCSEVAALEVLDISRATLYRNRLRYRREGLSGLEPTSKRPKTLRKSQWKKSTEKWVLTLRRQEPTWGKKKLHRVLVREHGINVSESTVGRILSGLLAANKVKPAYFAANKDKPKRRRVFNQHARRWRYGMKGKKAGELVQIDHMSVYCNSRGVKHFKAVCPVSRFMVCEVYPSASSRSAALFLEKVIHDMPFAIRSIQVDGGSEFRKDFEVLCKKLGVKLWVLPPRSPKYNGKVERCNGITRDDFYSQYRDVFDIATLKPHLRQFQTKYNTYRPHQALNNFTPMEYIESEMQNRAT